MILNQSETTAARETTEHYFRLPRLARIILATSVALVLGLIGLYLEVTSAAASQVTAPITQSVPFTPQAPTGEWKDQRQQDGCEEATAAMAMAWVGGEKNIKPADWRLRILILSTFEKKKYGEYRDVSLRDMVAWLFNDYFHYQGAAVKSVASDADIIDELEAGNIVLLPMNGRLLANPYFSGLGPERHMILVKGYDYTTEEFITNDPGTRRGQDYRYSRQTVYKAIRSYQTGYHKPFGKLVKEMIVVSPKTEK